MEEPTFDVEVTSRDWDPGQPDFNVYEEMNAEEALALVGQMLRSGYLIELMVKPA